MANFYNPKFNDLSELISFGENAIQSATDAQIHDTLINKMKDIYGNDIDISSASADGIWMAQLTNLYSKMFGIISKFSRMLNPEEASGKYLDICCSFSNIFRRDSTKSTCHISFDYIGNDGKAYVDASNPDRQYILLVDSAGKEWLWEEFKDSEAENFDTIFIRAAAGQQANTYSKLFTCVEIGTIELKYGSEVKLIDITTPKISNIVVQDDCVIGQNKESDVELRNRKTLEQGTASTTTLTGLIGGLRDIASIDDVLVYNNYLGAPFTPQYGDGQLIQGHSVYVCLRYNKQSAPDKMEIANTIFNKLTPGIGTQNITDQDIKLGETVNIDGEDVSWKICQPNCISLNLKILVNKNFAVPSDIENDVIKHTNSNVAKIIKSIYTYVESLGFKQNLTIGGIINGINQYSTTDSDNNIIYIAVSGEFTENIDGEDKTSCADKGNTKDYQNCNYTYFDYNEKVRKYNGTKYVDSYTVTYKFNDNEDTSVGTSFEGYKEIEIEIRHSTIS